jgi:LPXTG-motif cell wall-anchored protein
MKARNGRMLVLTILAVGAIGLACAANMNAQVQTTTDTEVGKSTQEVQVVRATVLTVSGNDLVVRMEDGSIRHISNVPESARATVDGREISIHDVKPGMHLQKTITTTTTPKVIVTTKTVTGRVWHVNPPTMVILTLEDGKNQQFRIPNGQMFTVNGVKTDAFGLKKGMIVSATKVVEEPVSHVEEQARLTGHMPPPPPAPAADVPILVAVAAPTPAPAAAPQTVAELPATGSNLPLIAFVGILLLGGAALVGFFRKALS